MNKTHWRRFRASIFVAVFLFALPLFAQDNPPTRAGRLSFVRGNVSFQAEGQDQWGQASLNATLTTGDRLYTDQGARAEVEAGALTFRMSDATDVTITDLTDQLMQLGLGQGTLEVTIVELPAGNSVEVDTPNGALTLQQAGSYRFDVDPNNGTRVVVSSGSVEASGPGLSQVIGSSQAIQLTGTDTIQLNAVDMPGQDAFDKWCADRDRQASSSPSAQYVSRYVPGYDDLDAYGTWQPDSQYGPVWYPNGLAAGWVPYSYGRWAWVEPWGWTWVETEPWGYAPFHYGRWAFVGARWGWIPGPVAVVPVYCPALVAFVGGPNFSIGFSFGNNGVAAWFPLGPSEPFLPWYHYGGNYLHEVNITNVRNVTNIADINNINHINYVNRDRATTAVPSNVFSSGTSVRGHAVRVSPQQLARAQTIPHPLVNPTAAAEVGGKPVMAPPVRNERFTVPGGSATRGGVPPASRGGQPPLSSDRTPLPDGSAGRPPVNPGGAPLAGKLPISSVPHQAPQLITRNSPPPGRLPFDTRQQAMAPHPGRPLEPQQRENLRAGRPAGPMRDTEIPSHPPQMQRGAPSPSRLGGGNPRGGKP